MGPRREGEKYMQLAWIEQATFRCLTEVLLQSNALPDTTVKLMFFLKIQGPLLPTELKLRYQ